MKSMRLLLIFEVLLSSLCIQAQYSPIYPRFADGGHLLHKPKQVLLVSDFSLGLESGVSFGIDYSPIKHLGVSLRGEKSIYGWDRIGLLIGGYWHNRHESKDHISNRISVYTGYEYLNNSFFTSNKYMITTAYNHQIRRVGFGLISDIHLTDVTSVRVPFEQQNNIYLTEIETSDPFIALVLKPRLTFSFPLFGSYIYLQRSFAFSNSDIVAPGDRSIYDVGVVVDIGAFFESVISVYGSNKELSN